MRKLIAFLALLSLFLITAAQLYAQQNRSQINGALAQAATAEATAEATAAATPVPTGVPAARPNIVDTLKADPGGRYTTLVAAIEAVPAVASVLNGAGPFTLLAPTDDAFAALETQTGMTQDQLLADQATLTKILLYHIVLGQHYFRTLTGGVTLPTELLGENVTFSLDSGVFTAAGQNIS
ncbi:MAG TPA: fasciclin domain-containing protein, partial [Phototrophicaceae bacterium]|nr:fasciclin domain-containing protein [Phototrophicaceae bacterium]